jgi:hypothetical protein
MRVLRIAFALSALLVTTPAAAAKPMQPDCEASLPAVQAAVAASCDCDLAVNHGQYVRCAGQVVKGMVAASSLDHKCKGAMVRVFAKSSCGKHGAVTCCTADRPCKVKSAAACERRGGTAGTTPFCIDACAASPSGAFLD